MVEAVEALTVTVVYRRRLDGELRAERFTVTTPVTDCQLDERRESLLQSAALPAPTGLLNGIDYLEVDPVDHTILRVTFLKPLPAGAYGIPADLRRISIAGGVRVVGIRPVNATVESASVLRIDVDRGGDYSLYTLTLDANDLDPIKRATVFSFMASCPTDADCLPAPCPPLVREARCSTTWPRTTRASAACCSTYCRR